MGGLSLGGYVALALAARHPDRVAALVLSNTRAEPDTEEAAAGRHASAAQVRTEGLGPFLDGFVPRMVAPGDLAALHAVRAIADAQDPEAVAGALEALAGRADRRPDLAAMRMPALVIAGSEDGLTPPALSEAMVAALPRRPPARRRGRRPSHRARAARGVGRDRPPVPRRGGRPPAGRLGGLAVAAVVRRRLRARAADLHRAPPAAAVAARVEVEHGTVVGGALPDAPGGLAHQVQGVEHGGHQQAPGAAGGGGEARRQRPGLDAQVARRGLEPTLPRCPPPAGPSEAIRAGRSSPRSRRADSSARGEIATG